MNVDEYIDKQKPDDAELCIVLRNMILTSDKTLKEDIKWKLPCYSNAKNVLYFVVYSSHVNLGFYYGKQLVDNDKLLEGSGKNLMHIKITNLNDLMKRQKKIVGLIKQAIAYNTKNFS